MGSRGPSPAAAHELSRVLASAERGEGQPRGGGGGCGGPSRVPAVNMNRNEFAAGVQGAERTGTVQAVAGLAQAKHPNDVWGPNMAAWTQEVKGSRARDRVEQRGPYCVAAAEVRDGRGCQLHWGEYPVYLPSPGYRQSVCPHGLRVKKTGAEPW